MNEAVSWPEEDGFHREYPLILSSAHRRRLTPLGAPALVRHLAFWNATPPDIQRDASKGNGSTPMGEDPLNVHLRALAADHCVAQVYRRLLDRELGGRAATVSGLTTPNAIRNWVVLFAGIIDRESGEFGNLEGEKVLTDSYRAIKFRFVWHGIETKLSFELHSEYLTLTAILDLSTPTLKSERDRSELFADIHETMIEVCNASKARAERRARYWRTKLYDGVWDEFSKDILSCLKNSNSLLGEAFVDFRGLVVRPRPWKRFLLPFRAAGGSGGPSANIESRCCPTHLARVWPLIGSFGDDSTEFTVSRFLKNRAIYATALGNQASLLTEIPPVPLHYFLYEDTLSNWQLGRLVYRIHRAGTARLAALMHFGKLRTANQILGEIESTLEEDAVRVSEDGNHDRLRHNLGTRFREIDKKLVQIADLKLEPSLEDRVERSRYYVNQFNMTVKALRIDRVEGYQTYQEFVEHRLGPMFDYIDRLGRKMVRIQQDRLLMSSRIQSLEMAHETYLISTAQRLADIGLSCVLGPYYVGYILSHAFSGAVSDRIIWLWAAAFGCMMWGAISLRDGALEREKKAVPGEVDQIGGPASALPALKGGLLRFAKRRWRLFGAIILIALPIGIGGHFLLSGLGFEPTEEKAITISYPEQAPTPEANKQRPPSHLPPAPAAKSGLSKAEPNASSSRPARPPSAPRPQPAPTNQPPGP